MKTKLFLAGAAVIGSIALILLRPSRPVATPQVQGGAGSPVPVVVNTEGPDTNALTGAYQMAAFIAKTRDALPLERSSTRGQLTGLQSLFFVSDYVMAAKTNRRVELSQAAIIGAFSNVSPDTSALRDRLLLYAERPGTLADHYDTISANPDAGPQIAAIKSAMTDNGVTINKASDLLMDCIRFTYVHTEMVAMYGAGGTKLESTTLYPPELKACEETSDAAFRERFTSKFGMNDTTARALMAQLKRISISNLSPADMEIPAHFR